MATLAQAAVTSSVTGTGLTISASITGTTSGNLVVCIVSYADPNAGSTPPWTPAAPTGATWLTASAPDSTNAGGGACIFYLVSTGGTVSATFTDPAPSSPESIYAKMTLAEFSGTPGSPFDVAATAVTNNSAASTTGVTVGPSGTLAQSDEIVISSLMMICATGVANAGIGDPPSGYTKLQVAQDTFVSIGAFHGFKEAGSTSGQSCVYTWTSDATMGSYQAVLATFKEVTGPATQKAGPSSDNTDGAWTPSTGTDLYATLDETSYSDTDYDSVTSNSAMRLNLAALSTPDSGTRTLHYRASGSGAKKLIARLIQGSSTTVDTFTVDPLPATVTQYDQTITGTITNYGDLDVEFEVADATSTPSPSITFGAIGTGANGSTTVAPNYPTGITAGMYLTCHVSSGATNSETPSTPSGWTSLGTGASTDGTYGIDTGPRRMTVFGKIADGTESGTLSVSITNGGTCRGTIARWDKSQASYTWDVVGAGANDSTSGTGFSATTASINWAVGDCAIAAVGQRVDTVTQSSQSLTASGTTFGTRTNRADTAVTTGNDHRHVVDTFAAATVGGGSAATTWAYTGSAACSGGLVVVRLREIPPTEFGRVTWAQLEIPAAGGQSGAVGLATETDAAYALGVARPAGSATETDTAYARGVSLPVGLATETDAAYARSSARPVGLATESSAAYALASARPAGLATEADSAYARGVGGPFGLATESDTAYARASARPAGLATETDAAYAFGVARPAGSATETDTAAALAVARPVGRADESDTASALSSPADSGVGLASETDAASALGVARPVGSAAETDTAYALTLASARAVGLASETDTAAALVRLQLRATGLASETDNAFALSPLGGAGVGLATETDTANALGSARPAARANETDAASALAPVAVRAAGLATETDTASALVRKQITATGLATETDSASSPGQGVPVGRANETDSAYALGRLVALPTGLAIEVSTAYARAAVQQYVVGRANETDTAFQFFASGSRPVGRADETDAALAIPGFIVAYTARSRLRLGRQSDSALTARIGAVTDAAPDPRLGRAVLLGGTPRIGTERQ